MSRSDDATFVRALAWQWASHALNAVFNAWTVSGSVFLLFLSELGLPKAQIGIVLSLFPFCGLLALWFAPVAQRVGRKRVFLAGYGARKVVAGGLLLLPIIVGRHGTPAGVGWLVAVIGVYAVLRALAETAYYPWSQEAVPSRVRGMFGAVSSLLGTAAAAGALLAAGAVVASGSGTRPYLLQIASGCAIGLVSVALMIPVPGGAPAPAATGGRGHVAAMRAALRDGNFKSYLGGVGATAIGSGLFLSFLPLFLRERLGIAPRTVVTLDLAVMVGGALSGLACGWAADRWGSRPVLMPSLALAALVPVGWLLLPRDSPHAVLACAVLYLANGVATSGVSIGSSRLLLNGVIPPERNTAYTAIYYAWAGLAGGTAPLLAGGMLGGLDERPLLAGPTAVDAYPALFGAASALLACGLLLTARVRPDGPHTTRTILGRLLRRPARRPCRKARPAPTASVGTRAESAACSARAFPYNAGVAEGTGSEAAMADLRRKFLMILTVEIEGLLEDLSAAERGQAERLSRREITEYVFRQNEALFRAEEVGLRRIKEYLDGLDLARFRDLDALVVAVDTQMHEVVQDHEEPEVAYRCASRTLAKVRRYVESGSEP